MQVGLLSGIVLVAAAIVGFRVKKQFDKARDSVIGGAFTPYPDSRLEENPSPRTGLHIGILVALLALAFALMNFGL